MSRKTKLPLKSFERGEKKIFQLKKKVQPGLVSNRIVWASDDKTDLSIFSLVYISVLYKKTYMQQEAIFQDLYSQNLIFTSENRD